MKKIFCFIFLLLIVSCIEKKNGFNFVEINKVENFDSFNFTKEEVIENIGLPSVELDENSWLYYSYVYKNYPWQRNKIYNEKILLVRFDDNQKVVDFSYENKNNVGDITNIKNNNIKNKRSIKDFFNGLIFSPLTQ